MSISFNHPNNTVTSTDSLILSVQGGTTSAPRSIRFNANSIIVPPRALPVGESGALVFDTTSSTLKYHNGTVWVELLSKDAILSDVNTQINLINTKLNTKVDTVTYGVSAVPSASISGTTLNIIFPTGSGGGGSGIDGLYTATKPGSIMHYALQSGQSIASIREQMGGSVGSQNGRNGSIGAPFITRDGWCLADGYYWTWLGTSGTVTTVVPNLNQNAYLKGINLVGTTKTDSVIPGGGTIGYTNLTLPDHYHGVGAFETSWGDEAFFINGKTFPGSFNAAKISGDANNFQQAVINGTNTVTAITTTSPVYNGSTNFSHNHTLDSVDVPHFNVAVLYNIAEQKTALPYEVAQQLYVKVLGDSMQGQLNVLTPTAPMNAATKQYVDTAVASAAKSYTVMTGARAINFSTYTSMATLNIPSSGIPRAMRITMPVFSVDEDGQGSEPGLYCYIRVNGVEYLSNMIWIPHDRYGNGLSYSWTPSTTLTLPANVSSIQIDIKVDMIDGLKNLRQNAGYTWVDVN